MDAAYVASRDTEHQVPSQKMSWPNGHWPQVDQITSVITAHDYVNPISVDGGTNLGPTAFTRPPKGSITSENSATTGFFGGSIPNTSLHWQNFFTQEMAIPPTGNTPAFIANPDPVGVVDAVAHSQNGSSGNGGDFWSTLQTTFRGAWRNTVPNGSYKSR